MSEIFEIEVSGVENSLEYQSIKKIKKIPYLFRVWKIKNLFVITCTINNLTLSGGRFLNERDAMKTLKSNAKTAMQGFYIYQKCPSCFAKAYYPAIQCNKCQITLWDDHWVVA